MKNVNIAFSPEFINEFNGSYQELELIVTNIKKMINGNTLMDNSSSMTFDTDGFDKILDICYLEEKL
jgi:hypothetical protein